jgi:hypothetical protein
MLVWSGEVMSPFADGARRKSRHDVIYSRAIDSLFAPG